MYSPKGHSLTVDMLKNGFENNPDGAGLMWQGKNGKVFYKKGYFEVEKLIADYNALGDTVFRAVHCRIATSGIVSSACCHPFPVCDDLKQMALATNKFNSKMVVMHNGVIPFCTPSGGIKSPFSDTMVFARDYLYPLQNVLHLGAIRQLMAHATNSRLLVFTSDASPRMIGEWIQDSGCFFSNSTYKTYKYNYVYDYANEEYFGNIKLMFCFSAKTAKIADDILYNILDSLEYDECVFPDYYSADASFKFADDLATFEVMVDHLPVSKKILDKYEYTAESLENKALSNYIESFE